MTPAAVVNPAETAANTLVSAKIFVRALSVVAQIGVYDHEHGHGQPLVIDAELDLDISEPERLAETVNYEIIAQTARAIADTGHIGLVETYAWRLATALLEDPRVLRARVRVEKPNALAPDAEAAGVEITLSCQGA
jgi:dihydroneopterin aldolase